MALSPKEIERRFSYHKPKDEKAVQKHEDVRYFCKGLAKAIDIYCPDGYEKDEAIKKIEEAMFWGNAAIARNGDK